MPGWENVPGSARGVCVGIWMRTALRGQTLQLLTAERQQASVGQCGVTVSV